MVIAYPATQSMREEIRAGSLFHVTAASNAGKIVEKVCSGPQSANCEVNLHGMQGWSVAPFRLLRDYSVLDPFVGETKTWGQYTYFFLGKPSLWAVKKNIGVFSNWGHLGNDMTVYEIQGKFLVKPDRLIFFRPDDKVVVIRGGYRGPARADPLP